MRTVCATRYDNAEVVARVFRQYSRSVDDLWIDDIELLLQLLLCGVGILKTLNGAIVPYADIEESARSSGVEFAKATTVLTQSSTSPADLRST